MSLASLGKKPLAILKSGVDGILCSTCENSERNIITASLPLRPPKSSAAVAVSLSPSSPFSSSSPSPSNPLFAVAAASLLRRDSDRLRLLDLPPLPRVLPLRRFSLLVSSLAKNRRRPPASSSPCAAASVRFCFSPTIRRSKELAAAHFFFSPSCSFVCQQRCRSRRPKTGSPLLSSLPPSGHASSSFQCCCRLHSPAPPTFPVLSRLLHRILPSMASYRQCRCFPSFPPASSTESRRRRRLPFLLSSSSPPRLSLLAAARVGAVFFLCRHQLAFTSFLTASPTPSLPP